jgi:hypothetical protein
MRYNLKIQLRTPAAKVSVAALCAACALFSADLAVRPASYRQLKTTSSELGGVVHYGQNHATYFLHSSGLVHRIGDNDETIARMRLQPPPEGANAQVLYSDIAVDSKGGMFVGATWTRQPSGGGAGVLVYDTEGRYERTIVLSPRSNMRHLAMDASGNLFVLGIDPGYFRGVSNLCLLVHKYSPDGNRVTAFSSCPIPAGDRSVQGPAWEQLSFEVDRGSLWIENGKLYHVLPSSGVIRVFDPTTGLGLGEIALRLPQSDELASLATGPSVAWRVLSRGSDGFLVVWSVPTAAGRTSVLVTHDRSGKPTGPRSRVRTGMPVASAPNGHIFFLSPQPDGTVGLLRGLVVSAQ